MGCTHFPAPAVAVACSRPYPRSVLTLIPQPPSAYPQTSMPNTQANILDLFRLDNKVALVTGAATGLGAAIATALSQAGATVAVHGNRRAATDTAAAITSAGGRAHAFQADLSTTTGPEQLFTQAKAAL